MAAEFVAAIGAKIGEYLIAPVGRQFGYLFFYKSNIQSLKKQVNKLEERRDEVQLLVVAAERNGELIRPNVEGWLKQVDEHNAEAIKILDAEIEADKSCLNGWCPNLKSCYALSRKAKKKAVEVGELQRDGNLSQVSYPAPPPGIETRPTEGLKDGFKSRIFLMNKVMKALKGDKTNMIGISGMGGVGKTTMVKVVAKKAKEGKLFDAVVMAVVSQNPDERKTQGEIADLLGLEFREDSTSGRADRLRARLKSIKKLLVILDDVWKRLELNDIGIPFEDDHKGSKILLTSRSQDVCNGMGTQKIFTIEVLPKEEARNLFKEKAGISNDTRSNLHSTQIAIADECGGLPIAIIIVGRALRGKGEIHWNSALQQLCKSFAKNIGELDARVFSSLELSFNYLSEEAKKCFVLCSLFQEDFDIPIEDIVRYGIGLEYYECIGTVGEGRNRIHALVDDLKRCHLLMDGEEEKCVKMHDVIRDVAISIASKEELIGLLGYDGNIKQKGG